MAKEIIKRINEVEKKAKEVIFLAKKESLSIIHRAENLSQEKLESGRLSAKKVGENLLKDAEKEALGEKKSIEKETKETIANLRKKSEKQIPKAIEFILKKAKKELCR